MAKKSSPFSGVMDDWEPVETPPSRTLDSSDRPLSKPDRVAREHEVLIEKYGDYTSKPADAQRKAGNPSSDAKPEHATLMRAKKKGALDNDVNAKTFVVSGNKIVGSQG